jgi:hypothetical protein
MPSCLIDITGQERPLQSVIGYRGINGVVHIEPNFRINTSLAVLTFPNIRARHVVEIRENRVLTDVMERCRDRDLGRRYMSRVKTTVKSRFSLKMENSAFQIISNVFH